MKKGIFYISLGIVIGSLISCNDEKDNTYAFVTNINMEGMAEMHLPGYYLQGLSLRGMTGREYFLVRESDTAHVRITIGIYKSAAIAENTARDFFTYCSALFKEGTYEESAVGDKCWYTGSDLNHTPGIVFIRKNALFNMAGYNNFGDLFNHSNKNRIERRRNEQNNCTRL